MNKREVPSQIAHFFTPAKLEEFPFVVILKFSERGRSALKTYHHTSEKWLRMGSHQLRGCWKGMRWQLSDDDATISKLGWWLLYPSFHNVVENYTSAKEPSLRGTNFQLPCLWKSSSFILHSSRVETWYLHQPHLWWAVVIGINHRRVNPRQTFFFEQNVFVSCNRSPSR